MTPAISVKNLSKKFKLDNSFLDAFFARFSNVFQNIAIKRSIDPLKNISFDIMPGETVGIIGKNGAGKTTLLKTIAGIYNHKQGQIIINGKLFFLSNLTNGMKIRLTVKDNIFLVASVLGLSIKETKEICHQILAFAGLEEYAYTKLFQMSKGMRQRLAFSISVHSIEKLNPDIIMFDESFSSSGDEEFSHKSEEKLNQLAKSGKTLVIVTHKLNIIKEHCSRVIWLEKGCVKKIGEPEAIISEYTDLSPQSAPTYSQPEQHPKKILVVSPVATHPQNSGNRNRIYRLLKNLQSFGYEIHFFYCGDEYNHYHVASQPDITSMKAEWDKVYIMNKYNFPGLNILKKIILNKKLSNNTLRVKLKNILDKFSWKFSKTITLIITLKNREISKFGKLIKKRSSLIYRTLKPFFPDANMIVNHQNKDSQVVNQIIEDKNVDRWYNAEIDSYVKKIQKREKFKIVLVEYVFISKVLENFNDKVLKIIDTHDSFTDRDKNYQLNGIKNTFFTTSKQGEAKGLNRADIVIAIQDRENKFFQTLIDKEIVTIGHSVDLIYPEINKETKKCIGYIGTASLENVNGLNMFIKDVLPLVRKRIPNIKLIIAGHICKDIPDDPNIEKWGEIPDKTVFYEQTDLVINPAMVGSGLKIKNIEALGLGKILITNSHSSECIWKDSDRPYIVANSPTEYANAVINILSDVNMHNQLKIKSYEFAKSYNERIIEALRYTFNIDPTSIQIQNDNLKKNKFVIFGFPRTGSSTLVRLFNLHSNITCSGEPFNTNINTIKKISRGYYDSRKVNNLNINDIIKLLFQNANGIKHLDYQLSDSCNRKLLLFPNLKFILLLRKNRLKRLVSDYISKSSKHWNTDREKIISTSYEPMNIEKEKKLLENERKRTARLMSILQNNTIPYYLLYYEDLVGSKMNSEQKISKFNEILHYLGYPPLSELTVIEKAKKILCPEITKLNSDASYLLIPNIMEVERELGNDENGYLFEVDKNTLIRRIFLCDIFNTESIKNIFTEINPSITCHQQTDYRNQVILAGLSNYRGIHIITDPRNIILSESITNKKDINTEISSNLSLEHLATWKYDDPFILEVKFEDLISNPKEVISKMLKHLMIDVDDDVLEKIVKKNSFENLSKGRKPGEENVNHHFRKGMPGDWKNHFNEEHIKLFKEKWGDLLIKLGYEKGYDWGK